MSQNIRQVLSEFGSNDPQFQILSMLVALNPAATKMTTIISLTLILALKKVGLLF
jgi:hypothetical protein